MSTSLPNAHDTRDAELAAEPRGRDEHDDAPRRPHTPWPVPSSAVVASFLLSLVGLGLSIYLTVAHFAGAHILACSSTGTVDCTAVTTSPQSYFLGAPVAVLGLGFYVLLTILNSPWGWRARHYWVHVARLVLIGIGMCFVLWLIGAELLIINHVCLYCTGVHVVTFILLILITRVASAQLAREQR